MHIRLLNICRQRQVTLAELSRLTGIARVSLSRYAHGVQDMTLGQALTIASCLGCRLSELVDDREDLDSPAWRRLIRKQAEDPAHKKDKSWVPRVLLAARAAKMRSMFVTYVAADVAENSARATASFTHYETLPPRFWSDLAAGSIEIANRSFA